MIDWSILWQAPNGRPLLEALLLTFQIAAISWALSMILGIGIGLMRDAPIAALRVIGTTYVEIFRNIPLLVQLFFVYFIFPRILPTFAKHLLFNYGWEIVASIITLSLYSSAKIAELVKSGFNTIGAGLHMAAASSGLTVAVPAPYLPEPAGCVRSRPGWHRNSSRYSKGPHRWPWRSASRRRSMRDTATRDRRSFQWLPVNVYASAVYLFCAWGIAGLMLLVEKRVAIPGRIGG